MIFALVCLCFVELLIVYWFVVDLCDWWDMSVCYVCDCSWLIFVWVGVVDSIVGLGLLPWLWFVECCICLCDFVVFD